MMTTIQYAWMIYIAGSLGCCLAAWWMFLWAWRFVRYSAVATVMVILFTPFAIDQQTMEMAPAIFTLVFDGFSVGFESIKPVIRLMVGLWLIAIILILVFVIFTRKPSKHRSADDQESLANTDTFDNNESYKDYSDEQTSSRRRVEHPRDKRTDNHGLTQGEQQARAELLLDDAPIRATRD